jgi:hypothetical protein
MQIYNVSLKLICSKNRVYYVTILIELIFWNFGKNIEVLFKNMKGKKWENIYPILWTRGQLCRPCPGWKLFLSDEAVLSWILKIFSKESFELFYMGRCIAPNVTVRFAFFLHTVFWRGIFFTAAQSLPPMSFFCDARNIKEQKFLSPVIIFRTEHRCMACQRLFLSNLQNSSFFLNIFSIQSTRHFSHKKFLKYNIYLRSLF